MPFEVNRRVLDVIDMDALSRELAEKEMRMKEEARKRREEEVAHRLCMSQRKRDEIMERLHTMRFRRPWLNPCVTLSPNTNVLPQEASSLIIEFEDRLHLPVKVVLKFYAGWSELTFYGGDLHPYWKNPEGKFKFENYKIILGTDGREHILEPDQLHRLNTFRKHESKDQPWVAEDYALFVRDIVNLLAKSTPHL